MLLLLFSSITSYVFVLQLNFRLLLKLQLSTDITLYFEAIGNQTLSTNLYALNQYFMRHKSSFHDSTTGPGSSGRDSQPRTRYENPTSREHPPLLKKIPQARCVPRCPRSVSRLGRLWPCFVSRFKSHKSGMHLNVAIKYTSAAGVCVRECVQVRLYACHSRLFHPQYKYS